MPDAPSVSLNATIEQAAAMLAVDPARAGQAAEAVLKIAPNDPRALLILGSARRRRGDPRGAKTLLAPLAGAYPRAANTHYELGLALADLGETAPAITALRHAVQLNRDLADAWRAFGDLLFKAGDVAGADAAYAEHRRASVTDPALKPVAEALFQGRTAEAEQALRRHVAGHLTDSTALRMLAELYLRQSRFADAEVLLARCLELDPGHDGARFSYADALFKQQKAAAAIVEVQRLLAKRPTDPAYLNLMAACLGLMGDDVRGASVYEALLIDYDKQPRIWLNYGHCLRAIGRSQDALAAYKRTIELAPGLGDAYWSLANLKVASFSEDDEAAMQVQLRRPDLSPDDRLHLHYALGKALEDRGDYGASFEHYAAGARLRRAETPYDANETTAMVRRSKALFTAPFFAARAGAGAGAEDPIFIVGLPRSGSTLIEQILASHSAVEGTMELPEIGLLARRLDAAASEAGAVRYPEGLAGLDAAALTALGESFIDATRLYRKSGKPFFIDKMPNNFSHIGLIQLILPKAKIIDARRHPLGSCFSAFKQHFAQGQNFSYDLTDLGRYYRDYVELMAHFDEVLPGRIHRVIYEDMVEDTETQVRRLLDYCGLPFEDACLRFYENGRAVRTVSSEQVRRPIFREGLEQWRRFEPWLGPLKAALGPALEGWRVAS
jgi:tetratricopeptide (TPR) repeat protein